MGQYNRKDHLYHQAKEEGYRSRAAYKLLEIDKKFGLFRSKNSANGNDLKVIDLGCAPGSWLQVASEKVGEDGIVIGIDRLEVKEFHLGEDIKGKKLPIIFNGDILDDAMRAKIIEQSQGKVDVILSDMSPDLSGVYFKDCVNSAELVQMAFDMAYEVLRPGGNIVTKIFPSNEANEIFKQQQPYWKKLSRQTLKSTRSSSKEIYFVGIGFNE